MAGQPVQAKRSGCLTGGLVVGGLIVLAVIVGGFFAWRFFEDEIQPEIEEATSSGLIPFSETPPGPCIDVEGENGVLLSWSEASCDGPRSAEITYSAAFNDGPFPGDEYLAENAERTCRDAFEGYVGIPPDRSQYNFSWIVPTEQTWAAGARHGICVVVPEDGDKLTGVIKGSEE